MNKQNNALGNGSGGGGGASTLDESPEFASGSASLLSSSVPVFSLEHVPLNGSGAAGGGGGGFRLTPTGSPRMPTTPNPTPIPDSHFRNGSTHTPVTASSHQNGHSASPAPSINPSAGSGLLSPTSPLPQAGGGGGGAVVSPNTGSSHSSSGSPQLTTSSVSSPLNIKRIDALPPPNFGGAAPLTNAHGNGSGTAPPLFIPPSSLHTTILPGVAPPLAQPYGLHSGDSSPTATGSAPPIGSAGSGSGSGGGGGMPPVPRPASSGLAAALSQAGVTKKLAAVDPEATNPYRVAIDSLKRLSEQKYGELTAAAAAAATPLPAAMRFGC